MSHNDSLEITGFFGQLLEEELIYEQSSIDGGQNYDERALKIERSPRADRKMPICARVSISPRTRSSG